MVSYQPASSGYGANKAYSPSSGNAYQSNASSIRVWGRCTCYGTGCRGTCRIPVLE